MIGDNNIAIWNIRYGEQKNIWIEGSRTKFLSYFMLVVLGMVILFVLFLIIILLLNSRRPRRHKKDEKPLYSYDNYFKRNKDFD
jgi:heme/copper-type cytochrome/quinol oxidase subunit 2